MEYIKANWNVPAHVHAVVTTRRNGYSQPPYESLNVGDHVGDDPGLVKKNREKIVRDLGLPSEPVWLKQVHSKKVVEATQNHLYSEADASFSSRKNQVCVVMTADCLPVVFYNKETDSIAAAHAGWRGLADGILFETIKQLGAGHINAWMGPAIGPEKFEVGEDVYLAFCQTASENEKAFRPAGPEKWYADLYQLAKNQLLAKGVNEISGGDYCTFSDDAQFYSYRREQTTGRMATLIWMQ